MLGCSQSSDWYGRKAGDTRQSQREGEKDDMPVFEDSMSFGVPSVARCVD